jgi:hypothetical protein
MSCLTDTKPQRNAALNALFPRVRARIEPAAFKAAARA